MTRYLLNIIFVLLGLVVLSMLSSCVHEPFPPEDFGPIIQDTMMIDTSKNACDTNLVYFNQAIQPLLDLYCATSGCHNVESEAGGVLLNNYENTIETAEVIAFDLNNSNLYRVITSGDESEVMPPSGKLDNEALNLVALWILQGAENLYCESDCLNTQISYSLFISDLMESNCNTCHSTSSPSGGIITDTHADLQIIANDGRLYGAISWSDNFSNMPQAQNQLDQCDIIKVKTWIDEGALDN